ncbi:hypothetical protein SNE40_020436 [Patella caerulea]|uniref:Uncharacterized protein n=1 Tax=Patella caerulea TaxID=87958 RepID=A0AAN8J192_PATCE
MLLVEKDIKVIGGGRVVVGSRIKMWWGPEGRWYKGTVIVAGRGSEELCTTPSEENSEENIPLSTLISRESVPVAATLVDEEPVLDDSLLFADEVLLTEAVNKLNSSSFLEENLGKDEVSLESVVSADVAISKIMESGHKSKNTDSDDENEIPEDPTDPDYVPEYVQELDEEHIPNNIKPITSGACHTPLSQILKEKNRKPEAFDVEGNAKQPLNDDLQEPPAKSRKLQVKYGRLTGSEYTTVSGVEKPAKKILKQRCNSNKCSKKGLGCELITEDRRNVILSSFYDQVSLTEQRNWLSRHIKSSKPSTAKENSRKTRTLSYYLPTGAW